MADGLLLALEVVYTLLFVWALRAAIRHGDVLARDVVFVFTPVAAVLFANAIHSRVVALPDWLTTAIVLLLLAQPVASLKLVADIRTVPRWLVPAFAVAAVVLAVAIIARPGPIQGPVLVAGILMFLAGQVIAAGYLVLEARRRTGGARIRLGLAAIGVAAIGVTLVVSSFAPSAAGREVSELTWRSIALFAALCFWIAFLPPQRLRKQWHALAAFRHDERLLATPAAAGTTQLWSELARTASEMTAAATAVVVDDGTGRLRMAATHGADLDGSAPLPDGTLAALIDGLGRDPVGTELCRRFACDWIKIVPIRRDDDVVGAVCLLRPHASLFDADDEAVVSLLAVRSAYLVQRRDVLAEEQRLTEQLRLTVTALETASAAKSDFLASMSHELRTPLNAIIGFSELMVADAGTAESVTVPREWVDHIRNGGSHLVSLINDVLDLAKVEAGRLELVKVPVDVGRAVAESVAGLRPLADRKNQAIEVDAPSLVIDVDEGRLRQVLYNLLSNAIKYTGEGGRIRVAIARSGEEVQIDVTDTGVGISPEDQPRVFEEFRQVGDPRNRVAGTGLGLALTRRLVEAHGGRIALVSVPGEGSTFTVYLPAGDPAAQPVEADALPEFEATARDILIIEDDPSSVRLLETYLRDGGYVVRVAADGETGLRMALDDPPAAILLDVLLPRMDGWEVLRRLKSEPAIRDVPVVIVTVVDERNVGLALGAVDYFVKPIEREALLARLERHMFLARARSRSIDVLAIDDDPAALDMIDATLAPFGFAVHRARNGQEGLHLVDAVNPDLVICDLLMPGVDGFEVVGRMHADPRTSSIPILVLTGHELSTLDKARLNGRILGVVDKGESAAVGLRDWLNRVLPDLAEAAAE